MSFYGQKINSNNKHLLETIKCRSFFGLDSDHMLPNDIEVSEEDFELLLDVIDLVGYNEKTIKIINKCLPKNYDLSKLPKELLDEMLYLTQRYFLLTACDKEINIWNTITGDLIHTIDSCTVRTSDGITGDYRHIMYGHNYMITCICMTPDNKWIISGNNDGTFKIWNAITYELYNTLHCEYGESFNPILCMSCSPDNKYVAIGSYSPIIEIWDITSGTLFSSLRGHNSKVNCICYSHDNKLLISGSTDYTVKIWDIGTGLLVKTLDNSVWSIRDVCCSSDNKLIAYVNFNGRMDIWNHEIIKLITTINLNYTGNHYICFSLDNKKILLSNNNHDGIKIWDVMTGNCDDHIINSETNGFSYSPDGKHIASICSNKIKIWDSESNKLVLTRSVNGGNINCLCFSSLFPDSELAKRIIEIKN
jgi:WD40 repeat protein